MFTRWLFTIFPADMRAGWRLVSANLALWIGFATATALSTPFAASIERAPANGQLRAIAFAAALAGLAQAIGSIPLFDDAYGKRSTDWARAASLVVRRAIPFALCVTLTVGGSLIAADVVMAAVTVILKDTPLSEPMVPAFGILVYVTLLTRFAFLPPLLVLHTLESLPSWLRAGAPLLSRLHTPFAKLVWPFAASTRLTQGMRWRLAPYVGFLYVTRLAGSDVPANLEVFFVAAAFMLGLTAQAVLFGYYAMRMKDDGADGK